MKRSSVERSAMFLASFALVGLSACGRPEETQPPRLVVQITLDQFRSDYLERYDEALVGGLRRLKDEGLWYPRAIVDHGRTLSLPGHATLATGSYPSTHGVGTNEVLETLDDGRLRRRILTVDPNEVVVGHPDQVAPSSRNIRMTSLADWVRGAHEEAEVLVVGNGVASTVEYGGHPNSVRSRNHVYWLSPVTGEYVTSSYFRDDYPGWVQEFNSIQMPGFRQEREWLLSVPESFRGLARRDDAPYEGRGGRTTFPHRFVDVLSEADQRDDVSGEGPVFNQWFSDYSPGADKALIALAKAGVEALSLGQDDATDYLAVIVGVTDRVGHDFGPRSLEQFDVVLRLDRELGSLFEYLDETVGRGRWIAALAADHGAPNIAEYEIEEGRPGRRVTEADVENLLQSVDRLVREYQGPRDSLSYLVAREVEQADFIARAMTLEELEGDGPADEILELYRKSHVPGHRTTYPLWTMDLLRREVGQNHPAAFGIEAELVEGAQIWAAPSAHGGAYLPNREVPILLMGPGVPHGTASERARTIDLAPTLASLIGLAYPSTVDGMVLSLR